jgi:hypothetical protein
MRTMIKEDEGTTMLRYMILLCARQGLPIDRHVEGLLKTRMWRKWGYVRLDDYPFGELGFDVDRAFKLVDMAIKSGFEDESLYALDEHDGADMPEEQATHAAG